MKRYLQLGLTAAVLGISVAAAATLPPEGTFIDGCLAFEGDR